MDWGKFKWPQERMKLMKRRKSWNHFDCQLHVYHVSPAFMLLSFLWLICFIISCNIPYGMIRPFQTSFFSCSSGTQVLFLKISFVRRVLLFVGGYHSCTNHIPTTYPSVNLFQAQIPCWYFGIQAGLIVCGVSSILGVCRFGTKFLRSFMMGFNKAWGLTTNVWSLPPVLRRWSIRRFLGIFTLNIGERMPQFDLRTFFSIVVAGFRCKNNNDRMKCLGFFQLFNTPWRERERDGVLVLLDFESKTPFGEDALYIFIFFNSLIY